MRFLFLTDTHIRFDRPKHRVDDIIRSQQAELDEIIEIAHRFNAGMVVHGGDVYHRKNPPHEVVALMIAWGKRLALPILSIAGNHDMCGFSVDSLRNSGLGVLFESGIFTKLDAFSGDGFVIKGLHAALDPEQDYGVVTPDPSFKKIVVSHNFIIPADSLPFEFEHPRDVKTNADLCLMGHYHSPFDYQSPTTRWINPGAISRWGIDERNRVPKVLIVDTDTLPDGIIEVPLTSARPGDELFDLEQLQAERRYAHDLSSFITGLDQTSFSGIDIEQEVTRAARDQGIPDEIVVRALGKIRQAKENLG